MEAIQGGESYIEKEKTEIPNKNLGSGSNDKQRTGNSDEETQLLQHLLKLPEAFFQVLAYFLFKTNEDTDHGGWEPVGPGDS